MPPNRFIPIAENNGLIKDLTEWVIRKACEDAKNWPDVIISINLSSKLFYYHYLVDMISNILDETQVNPSQIKFEITETAAMENVSNTISILQQLKGLGIQIALDDFGTGLSSLTYLHDLPLDVLKIDRSFIKDIVQDKKNSTILRRMLQLAKDLELLTIVEGVETEEQLQALKSEGVLYVQGYYYSPPIPKEQLTDYIKKSKVV
ncbi:EAL domain-containing protein [Salirhabdus salicampi]|uniref:EAL domain-containing protein n=1 Tax=Salirhabdus salicampi TaxID=476102 RepID=UPI0020C51497|nr:EAL domain-containing protein [Salirhabdus salicampi]MCP8616168.1 EAL domain-containing protein [Salirhabdus salicampi]